MERHRIARQDGGGEHARRDPRRGLRQLAEPPDPADRRDARERERKRDRTDDADRLELDPRAGALREVQEGDGGGEPDEQQAAVALERRPAEPDEREQAHDDAGEQRACVSPSDGTR